MFLGLEQQDKKKQNKKKK